MSESNQTKKLIAAVEKNEILYNPELIGNDNTTTILTRKIWKSIATECRFENAAEARAKWNALRKLYAKYLKQVVSNTNRDIHFKWAPEMEFLQPFVISLEVCSLVQGIVENKKSENIMKSINASRIVVVPPFFLYCEGIQMPQSYYNDTSGEENPNKSNSVKSAEVDVNSKSAKRARLEEPLLPGTGNLTPTELIFLGFARTLDSFPAGLKIVTKRKIFEIMHNAEVKNSNTD